MDLTVPAAIKITTHNQYVSPKDLSPATVLPSPLDQFRKWFQEATNPSEGTPKVQEPEAMSIATVNANGVPSVRVVLLKEVDDKGFVFFTNYESRKSQELAGNPHAALALYWKEVSRQIRVVGKAERVSSDESTKYYDSRPLGSRLGAWASRQSSAVGEGELEKSYADIKRKFGVEDEKLDGVNIPRPPFWGGWRVIPT
ncbi:hypothetical protein FRB96_004608 [Tulasnella sp. 330]|nr:hypothetical protein FRB96_004608 [Tulasnella sp. 330]KAG8871572.1 hypothetical protein FRB97_008495 [Tulasnella sp. 331]KAG8874486.1 hypothetical protein FRB98_008397 [Tulasnella sp. 332]